MMLCMPKDLPTQAEAPLEYLLPAYVTTVLAKNGIHTVEGVRRAYPDQLLKMRGIGMLRFRDIERAFFPGESFTPAMPRPPMRHVKDSSLNAILPPAIVLALARGGIMNVEQLLAAEPKDLLRIRGLGASKLREIESVFLMG